MKTKAFALLGTLALACTVHPSNAQSTAFTYQGALSDENGPADGLFDMTFGLFTTDRGGIAASTVTNARVEVVEGLFTTSLDFGAEVFDGTDYWLEIGVQAEGGDGFTTLSPRQLLNTIPYALFAAQVPDTGLSANVARLNSSPTFSGRITADGFTGDGSGLTHISQLDAPDGDPTGAVKVDNDGRVSIGGNPANAWFTVETSSSALGIEHTDGTRNLVTLVNATGGWIGTLSAHSLLFGTDNLTPRMAITAAGDVGIGTTSPDTELEITKRIGGGPTLRLSGPGGHGTTVGIDLATYEPSLVEATTPAARIEATDLDYSASIDFLTKEPGAGDHALVSRLHIAHSGNVGVGNTMPSETLEVAGRIVVADSSNGSPKAGAIRWTGSDFEGFNGSQWVSLTMPAPQPVIYPIADMVWIGPGTFTMGSPDGVGDSNERPQTTVSISRGFWMGKYEVTQKEYQDVVGANPSFFTGDLRRPVEQVTWHHATNYCALLTRRERSAGRLPVGYEYRLPTEAQWEYACRAGTTTLYSYGDGEAALSDYGWYLANSGNTTHPVGEKRPNEWGLYDMHGNVFEWCLDWYGMYPGGEPVTDPTGPVTGSFRVLRGGSWRYVAFVCRSAIRRGYIPEFRFDFLGFRVALVSVS